MRRSEDRLLQVFVGAFGLLLGVNIIGYVVLNRNYDRDRDALTNTAKLLIGEESVRASKQQQDFQNSIRLETRIEIEAVAKRFTDVLSGFAEHAKLSATSAAGALELSERLRDWIAKIQDRLDHIDEER
jgi:hypothetical protein